MRDGGGELHQAIDSSAAQRGWGASTEASDDPWQLRFGKYGRENT